MGNCKELSPFNDFRARNECEVEPAKEYRWKRWSNFRFVKKEKQNMYFDEQGEMDETCKYCVWILLCVFLVRSVFISYFIYCLVIWRKVFVAVCWTIG